MRNTVAAIVGAVSGVALMSCVAMSAVPAGEVASVESVEVAAVEVAGPVAPVAELDRETYTVEVVAPVEEVAPVEPVEAVEPVEEVAEVAMPVPGETVPMLDCVNDPWIDCDDPAQDMSPSVDVPADVEPVVEESPLPVGVSVYFADEADTVALTGAGVPCWGDLQGQWVCWFDGATGADVQG